MDAGRRRFEGLKNIIRFNYPFYVSAVVAIGLAAALLPFFDGLPYAIALSGICLAALQMIASLAASAYAYDLSGFYRLDFLPRQLPEGARILNLSAGFDECSPIIAARFPGADLQAYDFFDAQRHTEPSIRRARKSYPPAAGIMLMKTGRLPEATASADLICVILAAHEIRDQGERRAFFAELRRVLKPDGLLLVTEHLRDARNLLAYNVGALHFFPARRWLSDFKAASLAISRNAPVNPFIHCYSLTRDSNIPA